jgi:hypothetical protein
VRVVREVAFPGMVTTSCAEASPAVVTASATIMDVRTITFFTLMSFGLLKPVVVTWLSLEQGGSHPDRRVVRSARDSRFTEAFASIVTGPWPNPADQRTPGVPRLARFSAPRMALQRRAKARSTLVATLKRALRATAHAGRAAPNVLKPVAGRDPGASANETSIDG